MTRPRSKYRRSNVERRRAAEKLISIWYTDLTAEGATTYRQGGQKASVALEASESRDTMADARRQRPENFRTRTVVDEDTGQVVEASLTADGRDRRYAFVSADDPSSGTRWHDGGPRRLDAPAPPERSDGSRERYAREAMRHVARICREAHMVLEMTAAGWRFDQVADELGCGEPTARQLFEEGIGAVMSYQVLVKPQRSLYIGE